MRQDAKTRSGLLMVALLVGVCAGVMFTERLYIHFQNAEQAGGAVVSSSTAVAATAGRKAARKLGQVQHQTPSTVSIRGELTRCRKGACSVCCKTSVCRILTGWHERTTLGAGKDPAAHRTRQGGHDRHLQLQLGARRRARQLLGREHSIFFGMAATATSGLLGLHEAVWARIWVHSAARAATGLERM